MDQGFQERILASGIRSVLDLRGERERTEKPDDLFFLIANGIRYKEAGIRDILHYGDIRLLDGDLSRDYIDMLVNHKAEIRLALLSLSALPKPVLFHCNAGKDRTGILAMLLLSLSGIDKERILVDYCQTEENLAEMKRTGSATHREDLPEAFLHARKETMERTIAFLESLGGIQAYLLAIGLTKNDIEGLSLFR